MSSAVQGGLVFALLATGLVVVIWSFVVPAPDSDQTLMSQVDIDAVSLAPWLVAQVVITGLVWWISGWVVLGIGVGALVWVVRLWLRATAERNRYHEVTEAITIWTDMVKDALSSGAGLSQAIESTTKVAPVAIRSSVVRLASGQRSGSQVEALWRFGTELGHPTSDMVVLALVSASESQARDLPGLLAKTAEQARSRNQAVMQIETERSQLYAEARAMVLSIGVLGVIIAFLARDFLAPYDSTIGQLVLVMVMVMVVGSGALLVQAGRPKPEPRLLANEAVVVR